jgi:hypothetical protein
MTTEKDLTAQEPPRSGRIPFNREDGAKVTRPTPFFKRFAIASTTGYGEHAPDFTPDGCA